VTPIEEMVERSSSLKREVLGFARHPRFDRAFRNEIRRRFGDPIVAEEPEIANFFDWFIQEYRRPDGKTVVDCFLETRPDLPPAEREFLLGWRDVVEGTFEVTGRADAVLIAVNVIDDLEYRIRSNAGPEVFDHFPPGSFLLTRVVPLGEEWLMSGQPMTLGADQRDHVLKIAAEAALDRPELAFRNPERLARAWELQAAERAAFVDHFGDDTVILPLDDAAERLAAFSTKRYGIDPMASVVESAPLWAETIGLIYDETDGLGVYFDLHLVEEAFADPERTRKRLHRETLKGYLTDESLSPVPLIRMAERDHDAADRVFRRLLGKPRFSWSADGEALLRQHKPAWYTGPPRPRVTVLGERLAPYAGAGAHGRP
jgi:hypothetical protein